MKISEEKGDDANPLVKFYWKTIQGLENFYCPPPAVEPAVQTSEQQLTVATFIQKHTTNTFPS
jgi:hypothetical protein